MAKAFQFRLETVRRIRERARDAQLRTVAEAVHRVAQAETLRTTLEQGLARNLEHTRVALATTCLDVPAIRLSYLHQGWLLRKLGAANEKLSELAKGLESERTRLGEESARLKAIEKLRERQWMRHRAAVGREEQSSCDEAAVTRHSALRSRREAEGESQVC